MCMFCAAMPLVVGATAVAQVEQRKKLTHVESRKVIEPRRQTRSLSPRRITQLSGGIRWTVDGLGFLPHSFPWLSLVNRRFNSIVWQEAAAFRAFPHP